MIPAVSSASLAAARRASRSARASSGVCGAGSSCFACGSLWPQAVAPTDRPAALVLRLCPAAQPKTPRLGERHDKQDCDNGPGNERHRIQAHALSLAPSTTAVKADGRPAEKSASPAEPEALLRLVDDIDAALATNEAVIAMAVA